MTKSNQDRVAHKLAKFFVCALVLVLSIPGITALTLASVIIWFYGEDLLSGEIMRRFAFIEQFLPAVLLKGGEEPDV